MKRLILIITTLALPFAASAQQSEAEAKLAREVMYCGLYTMKQIRTQKRPGHEKKYAQMGSYVQVTLRGLNVQDPQKLQEEEEARIAEEVSEARSKGAFAQDAMRTYFMQTGARCRKVLSAPEVKEAHRRGVAATLEEQAQGSQAPEGKSDTPGANGKPEAK